MTDKRKILIAIDWYRPASKAGGPIASVENLIDLLSDVDSVEFYVVCGLFDYGSAEPLDVQPGVWLTHKKAKVQYWHPKALGWKQWRRLLREIQPDCVHTQGIWSPRFSILPLWAAKREKIPVLVSPRGMFTAQSLNQKRTIKWVVGTAMRLLGAYKNVKFHSTNASETQEIAGFLKGTNPEISEIPNVPRSFGHISQRLGPKPPKEVNQLRWLFLGRISPEKNPLLLLRALKSVNAPTQGYFCGGYQDPMYFQAVLAEIQQLPKHHKLQYVGEQMAEDLEKQLHQAHVLINASISENFGHAMAEGLSAGVPLIVGPNTPWQNLKMQQAGFVADYTEAGYAKAIRFFAEMDEPTFAAYREGAVRCFQQQCNLDETRAKYLNLYGLTEA